MSCWERLIRFKDQTGAERLGESLIRADEVSSLDDLVSNGTLHARCLRGDDMFDLVATPDVVSVKEILPLLSLGHVPIVKCVGLNYMKHRGWSQPPPYPSIFIKPRSSVAGFSEDIPIPKLAQNNQLNYEGELSILIGKTGKDTPEHEALTYIAGFVVSNDVSARKWQRDPAYAGGVPQWCFSKGFDKFAPLGPMLVSSKVVGNAGNLHLQTFVNGKIRQESNTSDLLFNTEAIVSFISQGTTLEAGTVVMTGTPAGFYH
ncbi:hypothetical protein BJX63DRAFT_441921 [Aspergillus granulosus]|uniref:Fumarylacetoacetase-like C-terminal domain-containing protein n=1 Tax=Aspergillus granulosus TaxID=176169 RepID=A0ABR4GS93_9EURO